METVYGHRNLLQSLTEAVKERRLSHAYILEGPAGVGKHTVARWLAGMMMCRCGGNCGQCDECRQVEAASHPDVVVAKQEYFQNDKIKAGSVEAMRLLRQEAYTKPFLGEKKLYVIPQADQMLAPAQNSLLKILEEPPEYCVFLLLCENAEKLLETVRSRSVLLRLQPLQEEEMISFLCTRYGEETARRLLRPSQGLPGRAIQMAEDPGFLQRREQAVRLFCAFLQTGDLFPLSAFLEKERDFWEEILDGLSDVTAEAAALYCVQEAASPEAVQLAACFDVRSLTEVFFQLQKGVEKLQANANYSLTVTELLMKCGQLGKGEVHD